MVHLSQITYRAIYQVQPMIYLTKVDKQFNKLPEVRSRKVTMPE